MRLEFDRTTYLRNVLGGITVIGLIGLFPVGFLAESDYLSYVGMATLLSGWGVARVIIYQKDKEKMELKDKYRENPVQESSSLLIQASQALSLVRGYAGVTASFAASTFTPTEAAITVKIAGTLAISSIYIESFLETVRLKQEIRFKQNLTNPSNELISDSKKQSPATKFFISGAIIFIPSAIIAEFIPGSPKELVPIFIILGSLSALFANRLNNMRLRTSLNSMSLLATPLNSNVSDEVKSSKSICYNPKKMSTFISYSATIRGIVGTVLTVGTFFSLFPVPGLRALGFTILTMNFMESILEHRNLNLEIEELSSSLRLTT